jgi:hypothetical protein
MPAREPKHEDKLANHTVGSKNFVLFDLINYIVISRFSNTALVGNLSM